MTYTDLNRFYEALKGRPKDRVPVLAAMSGWTATNFPEAPFEEIASNAGLIAKAHLWAKRVTGFDCIGHYAEIGRASCRERV